jgi:hypothetical protein
MEPPMMRRLAKQDRQDKVRSNRDYQTIQERKSVAIKSDANQPSRLTFCSQIEKKGNVGFIGAGLYISTDVAADLSLTLIAPGGTTREVTFHCDGSWRRVGVAVSADLTGEARLIIDIPAHVSEIHIWGLDCGALQLPDVVVERNGATEGELNSTQTPECLYLPQERAIDMDPAPAEWESASISDKPGKTIYLKKCAYCQRLLPLDPERPSALAFHKHNAKKTGHQMNVAPARNGA